MRLYLLRHAIAEDRDTFADTFMPDEQRPLTSKGRQRLKKSLKGLRLFVDSVDKCFASPLVRTMQTAEIFCEQYNTEIEQTDSLRPEESPEEMFKQINEAIEGGAESIFLVGHEPFLNRFVSWATMRAVGESLVFKKSGVCCLEVEGALSPGSARVLWFLGPSQLIAAGQA